MVSTVVGLPGVLFGRTIVPCGRGVVVGPVYVYPPLLSQNAHICVHACFSSESSPYHLLEPGYHRRAVYCGGEELNASVFVFRNGVKYVVSQVNYPPLIGGWMQSSFAMSCLVFLGLIISSFPTQLLPRLRCIKYKVWIRGWNILDGS